MINELLLFLLLFLLSNVLIYYIMIMNIFCFTMIIMCVYVLCVASVDFYEKCFFFFIFNITIVSSIYNFYFF